MGFNLLNELKKRPKIEFILAGFIILMVILQLGVFSQFKHLPGPIYGGDLYRNNAFIENILEGSPLNSDAYFANELNYYPWLWTYINVGIIYLFNFPVENFVIFSSILLTIGHAIIVYILGKRIFRKDLYALFLSILTSTLYLFFFSEPKKMVFAILVPLFILYFYKLLTSKEKMYKNALISGIFLGLIGLSFGGAFASLLVIGGMMLGLFFIFYSFNKKNQKNKNFTKTALKYVKSAFIMYLVAFVLFSLFYVPIQLKYDTMHNNVIQYGDTDVDLFTPGYILNYHFNRVVNFSHISLFMLGLFSLLGIIYLLLNFKKSDSSKFFIFWITSSILAVLHHYLTRPLFDTFFSPSKLLGGFFFIYAIFAVFGIKFVIDTISYYLKKNAKNKVLFIRIGLGVFIIFLILLLTFQYGKYVDGRWIQYGMVQDANTDLAYTEGQWFKDNLNNDDVVLSYDESGFMIAGLSGKKVMLSRRTHASYYVNINERIADAAVIMYGNDADKSKELLEKYGVTYFYMDQYLMTAPMRTIPMYESYLSDYGVQTFQQRDRFDIGTSNARVFDLLFVPPQNMSVGFQSFIEPLIGFQIQGQTVAVAYKVNTGEK